MALDFSALNSLPSAFDSTLGAFQGMRQQQAEQQQLAEARARKTQIQTALNEVANNPDAGRGDYIGLLTQFPELGDQLKAPLELMEKDMRESKIAQARDVYSALEGGNTDIAKSILQEQVEASENSNDKRGAASARVLLAQIEANPNAAKNSAAMFLASAMGPEEFEGMLGQLDEIQARRETRQSDLDQAAADLGLTKAQTAKTMADTKNLGVETRKLAFELEALKDGNNPISVEKRFDMEKALRSDYNNLTGEFFKVQDAYRRVRAAQPNAAGDLSLIFSFMKMLDPGSVVREGEFANAQNTTSVPEQVKNIYNRVMSGERLNENQRESFMSQTEDLMKAAKSREKEVRAQLAPSIKNYGLNADNVWGEGELEKPVTDVTKLSNEELDAAILAAQAAQAAQGGQGGQ